ncbi:DNA polymerase family A-domain-containing protein, partial [Dichotomocladium elegans]
LVFDVEVLYKDSHYPVIATAASPAAWYSWTSPHLTGESDSPEHLIPMKGKESTKGRLVVGHNVGYDRARIAEEYSRTPSGIRYLDTMSLHIAVSGLCSQQRPAWVKKNNEEKKKLEGGGDPSVAAAGGVEGMEMDNVSFFDVSSLNSLKDVAKFHCKVVLPRFRHNCPHPVSFAGMLHMGNSFLTVNENWERYLRNSSQKHNELVNLLDVKLCELADKAREYVNQPEVWKNDPWLSQLDWLVNPRQRKLKGQPKWYKDAYDTKEDKFKISIRSRIAPLLLRLKWQGYPLHHLAKSGWCYKVPTDEVLESATSKVVFKDEAYSYIKVPHKDGPDANCGNPLSKSYISSFENNVLTSEYEAARQALELNAKSAYWISSRERIQGQFVVWDNNPTVKMDLPARTGNQHYGMILPQMLTMGTITRRAVEKTWLTASNAKANRIGSELKSMVQAPEGYKIVGADVDSEELWISSIIGDAQFGFHGATALGWMTLQGSKSDGTDLHSKTANILGISRDKAKIFNYARIYGAGVKYAASLMLQYSQGMDPETAKDRALELYAKTKGEKEHSHKNKFKRTFWHGGSESYMFNALEEIALSTEPRTPVLGCAITDALKPRYTGPNFLTSRVNWVVQSSGVDYLHLLIVSMAHLIERYQIDARFMLSVHDEVRYLSSEKDQHRTALALQVANIWTRALFSYKLGLASLPQSVAFFSAVDIDHVLRKEPSMTCLTPSHEEKIEEGISCTIMDTLAALEKEMAPSPSLPSSSASSSPASMNYNLLGPERETKGKTIDKELLKQVREGIAKPRNQCDIPFLKAQMHAVYRKDSAKNDPENAHQTVTLVSSPSSPRTRLEHKSSRMPPKDLRLMNKTGR